MKSKAKFHIKHLVLLIFTMLFLHGNIFAQSEIEVRKIVGERVEQLAEITEQEMDFTEITENLYYFYYNPLNLNIATEDELISLGFLNANQIMSLLENRRKNGIMRTVYELKDLEGFYYDLIIGLLPFIKVEPPQQKTVDRYKNVFKYGTNDLMLRAGQVLEEQKGYTPADDSTMTANPNARYLGGQQKYYLKYSYTYKNLLSAGLVADKDAGEEFFKGSNPYGFDFYSAHIFAKDIWRFKSIALGDYQLEFGQGLTLWSGLGFGKSSQAISSQKFGRGLRKSSSSNENLYFRGAASTFSILDNLDLTTFYSNKGLDANLELGDTVENEEYYFQTIQESGYHSTASQVESKRAVNEQVFGGHIHYYGKKLKIGATAYQTIYDKPLIANTALYKKFAFSGDRNSNYGLDATYYLGKNSFFGELGVSKNGGRAMVAGMVSELAANFYFTFLYRDYSADYQVVYSSAFAESSGTNNERGGYFGVSYTLGDFGSFRAYYDVFKFDWLKFQVDAPSSGDEFVLDWEKNVSRSLSFSMRFKNENKQENATAGEYSTVLQWVNKKSFRIGYDSKIDDGLTLKGKLDISRYQEQEAESPSIGYLLYQDINYSFAKFDLDFAFRYAIFNTTDYDSRLYAYESDVLYKFSVPGYYYKGQRVYLVAHYGGTRRIDFWLKISRTTYSNKQVISSGLDEISGNHKTELTLQSRFKF